MSFAFSRGERPPKLACTFCRKVVAHRRRPGGLHPVRHLCALGNELGYPVAPPVSRKDRRAKAAASSCGCMDGECETCYPVAERPTT